MEALERRTSRPVAAAALRHRRPPLASRFTRFAAVGGLGVVVNSVSLTLLYDVARLQLVVASAASTEIAIIVNFLLDDRWTFGCRSWRFSRLAKFNLASLTTLVVTVAMVSLLTTRVGLHYLWANLAAITVAGALNFVTSATWVWGARGAELSRGC
jgi:putative flippase GtrA